MIDLKVSRQHPALMISVSMRTRRCWWRHPVVGRSREGAQSNLARFIVGVTCQRNPFFLKLVLSPNPTCVIAILVWTFTNSSSERGREAFEEKNKGNTGGLLKSDYCAKHCSSDNNVQLSPIATTIFESHIWIYILRHVDLIKHECVSSCFSQSYPAECCWKTR